MNDGLFVTNHTETHWPDDHEPSYLLVHPPKLKTPAVPFSEFQVIVDNGFVQQRDLDLIGFHDKGTLRVPETWSLADVLVAVGIFTSKGQARKSGWAKPIPDGFSEIRISQFLLFCWKPTE
jgi:hypothetical protein